MPSGERIGNGAINSEIVGEEERKTFEERGEKTLSAAEREQRIKELQEEKERLMQRYREIEEEQKRLAQEEAIAKQQKQAANDEIQNHIADPDEYREMVRKYNHDKLEELNNENAQAAPADPNQAALDRARAYNEAHADEMYENWQDGQGLEAAPADPNQAALDRARAYNEAHAGEMYENWQDGQDLPNNETEEQWAAFYQNQGEEFGTSEAQPATAQVNQAEPQITQAVANATANQAPSDQAETSTAEAEPEEELTEEEAEVVAAAEALPDTPEIPEVVRRLKEKGNKSKGFKRFFCAAAAAVIMALTIAGVIHIPDNTKATTLANPKQAEQTMETEEVDESGENENAIKDYESEKGIIDGYDKKGMFLSPNKGGENDFAAAKEVAEVCEYDECEMIKYVAKNQVESFADYLASMPKELQPEGFKGLGLVETEAKLESLSPEEFDKVFEKFCNDVDDAFTKRVELNGEYENAYMRLKDPSKPVTRDNIELVHCSTVEAGLYVVQFYWLDDDGNEIGNMTVKIIYDEETGDIKDGCAQAVHKKGTIDIYKRLDDIDPPESGMEDSGSGEEDTSGSGTEPTTGAEPTTGIEPTGEEITPSGGDEGTDINPKDAENLIRIDDKIEDEAEDKNGTEEIRNYESPGVKPGEKTEKPSAEEYQGTQPDTVPSDASTSADTIPDLPPDAGLSEDRGGANSGEYAPNADNIQAEQEADAAEIPVDQAPVSTDDIEQTLAGLNK